MKATEIRLSSRLIAEFPTRMPPVAQELPTLLKHLVHSRFTWDWCWWIIFCWGSILWTKMCPYLWPLHCLSLYSNYGFLLPLCYLQTCFYLCVSYLVLFVNIADILLTFYNNHVGLQSSVVSIQLIKADRLIMFRPKQNSSTQYNHTSCVCNMHIIISFKMFQTGSVV